MSAPEPDYRPLTSRQLAQEVNREVARVQREHVPTPLVGRGRKCLVCGDAEAKKRVNLMLTYGMRPQEIVDNLGDINARKRKGHEVSIWSVQNHRKNHFNVQEPGNEAYRRILERRASEEGDLLADGVGNLLTARGYLEIVANKGFQKLVEPDTEVGYTVGLEAQLKLEELLKTDKDQAERAMLRRDVGLIQQAIRETLTEEQMRMVSHKIDVLRGVVSEDELDEDVLDVDVVDDDDDDEYGPDYAQAVGPVDDHDDDEGLD